MRTDIDFKEMTVQDAMRRWPRLTAHLICESLGYFSPTGAAMAIRDYKLGIPNYCEWYSHRFGFHAERILEGGKQVLEEAVQHRRQHTGYMASYRQARLLVEAAILGHEFPLGGSW